MKILKIKLNKKVFRIKDCSSYLSSAKGLMFCNFRNIDGALIKGNSIWMPFCSALTLIFLDKNYKPLKQVDAEPLGINPKTWKIYRHLKAKYCLEIKSGLIKEKIKRVLIEK